MGILPVQPWCGWLLEEVGQGSTGSCVHWSTVIEGGLQPCTMKCEWVSWPAAEGRESTAPVIPFGVVCTKQYNLICAHL